MRLLPIAALALSSGLLLAACQTQDTGGAPGTDHLFLVNKTRCERIDATGAGTPYFARLAADVRDRTQTAMMQSHAFKATELALEAQRLAELAAGYKR